ncbi:MAG: hypothetical protein ACKVHQ_09725 [Gammaproteobacteria bacterium]|jgi:hypothetical protein
MITAKAENKNRIFLSIEVPSIREEKKANIDGAFLDTPIIDCVDDYQSHV